MTRQSTGNSFPEGLWNTHIDCLTYLSGVLSLDWHSSDIAGITGLAYRTVLCAKASPASTYSTWDHAFHFQVWCSAIGIDTDSHSSTIVCSNVHHWLDRRLTEVTKSLEKGLPVIFFDSLGFGLILGYEESDRSFRISGIPRRTIHPVWQDHPDARGLISRLYDPANLDHENNLFIVPWSELGNSLTGTFSFVLPVGIVPRDRDACLQEGITACCRELNGEVGHQISHDLLKLGNQPLFGNPALARLISELESRTVNHFGLIQAVNTICEARLLGLSFLRSASESLPQFRSQLQQSAEFAGRSCKQWRRLSGLWNLPMDRDTQMNTARLQETRELLYQISRTEQTIGRLLATVYSGLDPHED